ncbi:uncharacterized protein FRV6_14238 [Fusarium oxysporum]|uniref:Uncharacterized protein n=1 Tax=Fusarium oxysporum TaxID=5507 RepID=A0A2H3TZB8_FUSOX|nr:uncharacterized protein FRV6_14238 [Fusarium oxysporum]
MMLMVFRLSTPGSSPPSQARLDRRCVAFPKASHIRKY